MKKIWLVILLSQGYLSAMEPEMPDVTNMAECAILPIGLKILDTLNELDSGMQLICARHLMQLDKSEEASSLLQTVIKLNEEPFKALGEIGLELIQLEKSSTMFARLQKERLTDKSIKLLLHAIEKKNYVEGYLFLGDLYNKKYFECDNAQQKKEYFLKALEYYTIGGKKGSDLCLLWQNILLLMNAQEENNKEKCANILAFQKSYLEHIYKKFIEEKDSKKKIFLGDCVLEWSRMTKYMFLSHLEALREL